jgi:alpha-L-rhamnosidase
MGNWRWQKFVGERIHGSVRPEWRQVAVVDVPPRLVTPQMSESNRIAETLDAKQITPLADNSFLVDFGTNIIGWAEAHFTKLSEGREIVLEYAEHLDADGNIVKMNQTDRYIASGQERETFRNRFTYRGFRYIKVSGLERILPLNAVKALAIHADFGKESAFRCSDPDMNAIHDLIQNTLRNLCAGGYLLGDASFERLGYGGEGHAATLVTSQTFFNLAPLYANWLAAWNDCMRPDGGLPYTAPCPYTAGGGPFWCAIIVNAPWSSYVNYGDRRIIETHYPAMKRWLGYVERFMPDGLLRRWEEVSYRNHGWYLGDWATPTDPPNDDPEELKKYPLGDFPSSVSQWKEESIDLLNNCAINECYLIIEQIARTLGHDDEAQQFRDRRIALNKRIRETFFDSRTMTCGTGSQVDLAYPMLVGATPENHAGDLAKRLLDVTENRHRGHLATGFLGLQVLTEWSIVNNQPEFMYGMLKKRDYPGYLDMLRHGATATWEHWNAERSHIHNCYNGIGTWFYQAVGGVRPDPAAPGYRRVIVSPQIPEGITWAEVTKETPFGTLVVKWEKSEGTIRFDITVPVGSTAELLWENEKTELESGQHRRVFDFKLKTTIQP